MWPGKSKRVTVPCFLVSSSVVHWKGFARAKVQVQLHHSRLCARPQPFRPKMAKCVGRGVVNSMFLQEMFPQGFQQGVWGWQAFWVGRLFGLELVSYSLALRGSASFSRS
jgi:hypothetical protein